MKWKKTLDWLVSIALMMTVFQTCLGSRTKRQIGFASSGSSNGNEDDFRRALQEDQDQTPNLKFFEEDVTSIDNFLRENDADTKPVFSRNQFSFPKSVRGNACRTPFGRRGTCSYINDPQCRPIRRYLFIPRYRRAVIDYIIEAIEPPCGFDNGDFTMCCFTRNNSPTSRPTTTTTTTTRRPDRNECGISTGTRIVNGEIARAGSWPWQVALGKPKSRSSSSPTDFRVICGGTLISQTHVLSAAHCFTTGSSRNTPTVVRLGEHDLTTKSELQGTLDRQIDRFITHERFSKVSLVNDLAVVKMSGGPVRFTTTIRAACLPFDYVNVRDATSLQPQPYITGWGALDDGQRSTTILRQAQVPIVSYDDCKERYSNVNRVRLTRDQICAGRGSTDTCAGDSGGPLVSDAIGRRWSVIGVTSYGVECGSARHPGVYVRVDKYLDWIQDRMRDLDNGRRSSSSSSSGTRADPNKVRFNG